VYTWIACSTVSRFSGDQTPFSGRERALAIIHSPRPDGRR
jgi:hypothetical protein